MTGTTTNNENKGAKRLYQQPWAALGTLLLTLIILLILSSFLFTNVLHMEKGSPMTNFLIAFTAYFLIVFIIIPFSYHLPYGKTSYSRYLYSIGFSRVKPLAPLIFLGLSCYLILFISQAFGPLLFRISSGEPVDGVFLLQIFDLRRSLPPLSNSLLENLPSILEEVFFRGIILSIFLARFGWKTAIYISALTFGLIHMMNFASDKDLIWVIAQVVWTMILGTFYGYVFVKTRSLLPVILVHYLGKVFVGSITSYLSMNATIDAQAIYGVIFTFGLIPTMLMILWARFYIHYLKLGVYIKNTIPAYTGNPI